MAPNPVRKKKDNKWYYADVYQWSDDSYDSEEFGPFDSEEDAWKAFKKFINKIQNERRTNKEMA